MILAAGMIEPTWQVAVFVAFRVASALPTLRWPFAGALIALVADFADLFLMDAIGGGTGIHRLRQTPALAFPWHVLLLGARLCRAAVRVVPVLVRLRGTER